MDIRVLRYFLALANTETISGAAEFLHTTQPNVSRQLSELEKEVGRQLFIRGSRKITLTEEGMFLRKRAQEIVDLLDKTEQEFSSFDDTLGGDVYIGGWRILYHAYNRKNHKEPSNRSPSNPLSSIKRLCL